MESRSRRRPGSFAWPTHSTWRAGAHASRSRPRPNIHSISAAAIDAVAIEPGEARSVRVDIEMNNSAGLFQIDELLATKLRGSGIEEHIEVVGRIDAEHEKRLVPVFRI
jgi:metal-dependent HD superfamily phosphatase/phosphodiesterase